MSIKMAKPDDEMFHWFNKRFNVTHLKEWIADHPEVKPYAVPIRKYAELMLAMSPKNLEPAGVMMHMDWEKVKALPEEALAVPIIGVMIPDLGVLYVDGNHRIARGYRDEKLTLPAVILTATQAAAAQSTITRRLKVRTSAWPGGRNWEGA